MKRGGMSKYFKYIYLDSGIHCFRWLDRSEAGVDEFFKFINQLYSEVPSKNQTILILHDYREVTALPVPKIQSSITTLQNQYPHLKRKIAYLSDDALIKTLIDSLTLMSRRTGERQYFNANKEQQAINWLLTDND